MYSHRIVPRHLLAVLNRLENKNIDLDPIQDEDMNLNIQEPTNKIKNTHTFEH